jgi:hypothetical protein
MNGSANQLFDLADACQAQADRLQNLARILNFQGTEASQLMTREHQLRWNATDLRTSAVSVALANSQAAQESLQNATDMANKAASKITKAEDAIKVAGLVISLAASVYTGDIPSILTSADALINTVGPML